MPDVDAGGHLDQSSSSAKQRDGSSPFAAMLDLNRSNTSAGGDKIINLHGMKDGMG